VSTKIGLFFVPFYIKPVCFSKELPIDMTNFIARTVGTMFCKFHRKAMIRAPVLTNDIAFHNEPRP
jgi:hypothetical protein